MRALAIVLLLCLVACSPKAETAIFGGKGEALRSEALGTKDLLTINSLMIDRVQVARDLQVEAAQVDSFNRKLVEQFSAESGIDVVSAPAKPGLNTSVNSRGLGSTTDATLRAEITRYADGTGSALGASQASLFAATFSIVRNSDQKEIWSSNYYSTEHPESVNLIEVTQRIGREKEGKPSAGTLASEAARSAALDFSSRRVEQFSRK